MVRLKFNARKFDKELEKLKDMDVEMQRSQKIRSGESGLYSIYCFNATKIVL